MKRLTRDEARRIAVNIARLELRANPDETSRRVRSPLLALLCRRRHLADMLRKHAALKSAALSAIWRCYLARNSTVYVFGPPAVDQVVEATRPPDEYPTRLGGCASPLGRRLVLTCMFRDGRDLPPAPFQRRE
jgi:hypothetical protein